MADRFTAEGVGLHVSSSGSARILVDRARMLQVLTNLLDNARRHTPAGHDVTLAASDEGNWLTISVTDDGEGIAAAQLPHIFERFFRGDSARSHHEQGSGIGLTISRAIAEAHGARLDASSEGVGRGAAFTVTIPMSPQVRSR